jgi:hypothetical protein
MAADKRDAATMDVFILHADAEPDTTFVRSYLVPALGLETGCVLLSSDLPLGIASVEAIERGVTASRVTIVVVSPALLHERWALFGEALAGHHAAQGGLLIPLLLADCALPLRHATSSIIDFSQRTLIAPPERCSSISHMRH